MKKQALKLAVAIVALTTAATPVANASADTPQQRIKEAESITLAVADGKLTEDTMNAEQKRLFREYNTPAEIMVTKTEEPASRKSRSAGNYCRQDGVVFEQKALLGNVLYTFWQKVEICGTPGTKVHNVRIIDRGGETKTPTWHYNGEASPPASFASGNGWFVRTSENFEQKIVIEGIGMGQRTECISADILPSGEYNARNGCH